MIHESVFEIGQQLKGAVGLAAGKVEVLDPQRVRQQLIDTLVRDAVFGPPDVRAYARWLIWEIGQEMGARPASIHELYMARARDEYTGITVPAMNIRMMSYDMMRAAMRAAQQTKAAALIFEIARSEMGYTEQEPAEYSAVVIAAAIREGYTDPLFIQGDHFQVKASKFKSDPAGAIKEVTDLIAQAIPVGFWNIDIDTSTLVSLESSDLAQQQLHNYTRSAEITALVRRLEPAGVTVSLGGEIGEVGEKNSTPEELDAYISHYERVLAEQGDLVGLSKISVQTGTSHGGVVLPDGTMADVAVDFDTLRVLGDRARQHGAGGAVQHGASTLPEELFTKFPEVQTLEIHLATGFMNLVFDHPSFPKPLLDRVYHHLSAHHSDERKATDTDAQFYYKTRKKACGPFKAELWRLPGAAYESIVGDLEQKFAFFYHKLHAANTQELVRRVVTPVPYHQPMPKGLRSVGDDQGLAD